MSELLLHAIDTRIATMTPGEIVERFTPIAQRMTRRTEDPILNVARKVLYSKTGILALATYEQKRRESSFFEVLPSLRRIGDQVAHFCYPDSKDPLYDPSPDLIHGF